MKRRSLQSKVQLAFAFALLSLGVLSALAVWVLSRNAVQSQVRQDVGLASVYLREYLEQRRTNLSLQTRLIVEQPAIRAIAANADIMKEPATIADRLDYYRKAVGADGLVCYRPDGSKLCELGVVPSGLSRLTAGAIQSMITDDTERQGTAPAKHGFLLSSLAPVKVGEQIVAWVTAYALISDTIARQISESIGVQLAFHLRGQVVATSLLEPTNLPMKKEFHISVVGKERYGSIMFELGGSHGQSDMTVTVLRSEAQATKVYRTFTTVFLCLLPFAVGFSMWMASGLTKGISRPLASVVAAAEDLQQGQWPNKLQVTNNDEIGLLQEVFNETVDSLKTAQERLVAMIDVDPLTDLINHRKFKEVLASEVARADSTASQLSMLMVDIDRFKDFNTLHGMAAGDQMLAAVASILRTHSPEFAVCARFAGEEFAILLPNSDLSEAEGIAEAIRGAVEASNPHMTISIGCAEFGVNTGRAEGLTIAAELALARAKQLGRNQVCRFDSVPGADQNADPYLLYKYTQDASLATIQALAAAVDAKDSYTEGHSRRVAQYAMELGRFLGCDQATVDLIYRTGTLHDVGKIGVPDTILKKPGHLDAEERKVMETHPVLGELIVRKAPQLEDTVPGVRHHHEMWNGEGYPDKLKGEDIPYVARILAIADTFDAMTSDRPYRKGLSVETALAEIKKGSGVQFEPRIASAFLEMMSQNEQQVA